MAGEDAAVEHVKQELMAVRSAALKAAREYRQYLSDAEVAGLPEVAFFLGLLIEEDCARAAHCLGLLHELDSQGAPGAGRCPRAERTTPAARHDVLP